MNYTIEQLNREGFIFEKFDISIIDFKDLEKTAKSLINVVNQTIQVDGEELYYDIDTIEYNQEIRPHYHVIPGSFQVVIWLIEEDFKGREFIFGKKENLKIVKPKLGYFCIMKPNDPNFLHGVTKLVTKVPVRSIGISSLVRKVEGNQDIFVDTNQLSLKEIKINTLVD